MSASKFDLIYRKLLLTKFFTKGWGKTENIKRLVELRTFLTDREKCSKLVEVGIPVTIDSDKTFSSYRLLEGKFLSPAAYHFPDFLPEESKVARFQVILPLKWRNPSLKPVCLHLAGTGDHYFWRRRLLMAIPLVKEFGIGSILLENPFYGYRKPKDQVRSSLLNVSDLFVMGGCLVLESLQLLNWAENQGFKPLGLTGISMGGHMASLAASAWPKPCALVPCLSGSTASFVFTQGVLSGAIPWETLKKQYKSDVNLEQELRGTVVRNRPPQSDRQELWDDDSFSRSFWPNPAKKLIWSTAEKEVAKQQVELNISTQSGNVSGPVLTTNIISQNPTGLSTATPAAKKTPTGRGATKKKDRGDEQEVYDYMRGMMDEFTHLRHFPSPVDQRLIIGIAAKRDGYVPHEGISGLIDLWPQAEIRYLPGGHINSILIRPQTFRTAIFDAMNRTAELHYNGSLRDK